jgi:hypothetical protein
VTVRSVKQSTIPSPVVTAKTKAPSAPSLDSTTPSKPLANPNGFDALKKKLVSVSGRFKAATAPLATNAELSSLISAQRSFLQGGGTVPTGGTVKAAAMKTPGNDVAKAAGFEITRYSDAELKKLDVVRDGKLDKNELNGVVRFADVNDDGKVDPKELLALDYVVGKDTTIAAAKAFTEVHGAEGGIDDRSTTLNAEVVAAEAGFKKADASHDTLVHEVSKMEAEMRSAMADEGVTWLNDSPKQIKEQIAALGKGGKLDAKGQAAKQTLELQLIYSEMRESNAADLTASYDVKTKAKATMDSAKVENRAAQSLFAEAGHHLESAKVTVARFESKELINSMVALRGEVEDNPKVNAAILKYAKAGAILEAVNAGKFDTDDVDVDKVRADLKSSRKIIDNHASRLEAGAKKVAKNLEDPAFQARMNALPDDERTQALTEMHSLIADTDAGRDFFHDNILPGLKGKTLKRPEIYDDLKMGRHSAKLGLNLAGIWGTRIAKEGGKDAVKLMDTALARAIGIRPDQMGKVYDAMEAGTKATNAALAKNPAAFQKAMQAGDAATTDFLRNDPELGKISTRINVLAGGIAFASATLAAVDLVRDPSLRTSLGAAKGAAEIAEVLSRAKFVPASVARYARIGGRLAPPLDAIIGGLDGYKAAKRNDIAGAIGGFTQSAGGVVGTAGAIAAMAGATGVGLPLAVVGGTIAVVGSLITTIWGDSPTEQWLKDNAPEYIK